MIIKKDKNAYLDTIQEIGILSMLNHPNVIKLYEVIDEDQSSSQESGGGGGGRQNNNQASNKEEDKLYLVLEYC